MQFQKTMFQLLKCLHPSQRCGLAPWLIFLSVCITSCAPPSFKEVYVGKGQRFYAYQTTPDNRRVLTSYSSQDRFRAILNEDIHGLYIYNIDTVSIVPEQQPLNIDPKAFEVPAAVPYQKYMSSPPHYFYSATEAALPGQLYTKSLHFTKWVPYIQAMVVPIKFRGNVSYKPQGGTDFVRVPSQIETGLNAALAFGIKNTWNWYRGAPDGFRRNSISLSNSFGPQIGLGLVDLNHQNTVGVAPLDYNKKSLMIPVGVHYVLGVNNLNLGVVLGVDFATGPYSDYWIYTEEPWFGIAVGIDIAK